MEARIGTALGFTLVGGGIVASVLHHGAAPHLTTVQDVIIFGAVQTLFILASFVALEVTHLVAYPVKALRASIWSLWRKRARRVVLLSILPTVAVSFLHASVHQCLAVYGASAVILWMRRERYQVAEYERVHHENFERLTIIRSAERIARIQKIMAIKGVVFIGAYRLEEGYEERQHILISGLPGAGKSMLLDRLLLPPMVNRIGYHPSTRALVQDVKGDKLGILEAAGAKVYRMNPLDPEGYALDLSEEIVTQAEAENFADVLIFDSNGNDQKFFFTGAKNALSQLIFCLILKKRRGAIGHWDLRTLVLLGRDLTLLKAVLDSEPETRGSLDTLVEIGRGGMVQSKTRGGSGDIITTVKNTLEDCSSLAALWATCPRKISVRRFMQENAVLHVGWSSRSGLISRKVNRILLDRFYLELMAIPESKGKEQYNYIVLDEAAMLSPLPHGDELLKDGRSKGAIVVTVIQDEADFIGSYIRAGVPEKTAEGILALAGQLRAVFRQSAASERNLINNVMPKRRYIEERVTYSNGGASSRPEVVEAPGLDIGTLQNLPKPNPVDGLCGYFYIPGDKPHQGWHFNRTSWEEIEGEKRRIAAFEVEPEELPEDSPRLALAPFSEEEIRDLTS